MYSLLLAALSGFALVSSSLALPVLDISLVSRQYYNNDPEVYDAGNYLLEQMNVASAQMGSIVSQNADDYFDAVSVMAGALQQTANQLDGLPDAPSGSGRAAIAQVFNIALTSYFQALVTAHTQSPDFAEFYDYELDLLTARMAKVLQRTSAGTLDEIAATGGSFYDIFLVIAAHFPETYAFLSLFFSGTP